MSVLPVCISTYMYAGAQGQKKAIGSPVTKVRDDCELPCVYWELNPDPQQEQQRS